MSDEFSSQPLGTQRFGIEIPTDINDLIVFMEERLKCGICLCSVDENPVRLPCNHIYCSTCSKDLIRHTNACPECRTKFIPRQMKGVSLLGQLSNDLTELFPKLREFVTSQSEAIEKAPKRRTVSVLIDNKKTKRSKPNDEIHENLISSIHSEAFRPQEASQLNADSDEQDIPKMEVEEIENLLPNVKSSPLRHSNSSKESFKKTVSFTKQAINMMEMNTDDMLENSQVLSQLDNLINYVDKNQPHSKNKNDQDIPTDELFDQLSFSPCAYIHPSLQTLDLPIRHESVFSIVEYVVVPFSLQPAHEYLLECMLAIVNNCALTMYKKNKEFNLKENHLLGNTMRMKSLKNSVIVHPSKNDLMSYIVESQGGFVLDHYPHSTITQDYEIVQIREIADMSRFLIQ